MPGGVAGAQSIMIAPYADSISILSPFWQDVALLNPVVYLVSGFRWSFYGVADVSLTTSLLMTFFFLFSALAILAWIFKTGYRLKS